MMSEPLRTFNPGDCIAEKNELEIGQTKKVKVWREGEETEILLLRTTEGYRSYVNRCRHLSVPLDWGDGEVLDDSGSLFLCRTHGALFRPKDGLCVSGPCQGLSLFPVEIAVRDEAVYLNEAGHRS